MSNTGFIPEAIGRFSSVPQGTIAFSIYDGRNVQHISYDTLRQDILKTAGFFISRNIVNQHIAIIAPNCYEWITTFWGIAASGNTAVLLNPDLPEDILQWQCEYADVGVVCGINADPFAFISNLSGTTYLPFAQLQEAYIPEISTLPVSQPDNTLLMMFTSGTTGKSKIVEFTIANIQSYLLDVGTVTSTTNNMLLISPLHHVMGLVSVLAKQYQLQTICIGRGAKYFILDMPALNPTFVSMVPSMLESLVKLLRRAKTPQDRQKFIGTNLECIAVSGASANTQLCSFMMDLGFKVQSAYGMTETAGAGTWCEWNPDNIGSIGKPYGSIQCRIEDGELLLKSPSVMKGYYKDPEETAKVIVDGWIHTGDMGYCDESGHYYITGRKKNVIILSNGENVNPEEIEAKWSGCEAILESMVYSDGKGICAEVYTERPEQAKEFIAAYNADMPMYRQVYKVNYSSVPLEKTASGKIKRKANA